MRINLLPALFVILAFVGIAVTFNTCTDESTPIRALEAQGMTNVKLTGYRLWGCSDDDIGHFGFKATGVNGKQVSGVVCVGALKGSTVRFD